MVATTHVLVYSTTTEIVVGRGHFAIRNGGASVCWLGGVDVTTSNGLTLTPGSTVYLRLGSYERLYALTASSTTNVETLTLVR